MRLAWSLLSLPLLAACNSTPSAVNEGTVSRMADRQGRDTAATAPLPAPDTARAKAVSAHGDTLRVVRQRHNFSNPKGPAAQRPEEKSARRDGRGSKEVTSPRGRRRLATTSLVNSLKPLTGVRRAGRWRRNWR